MFDYNKLEQDLRDKSTKKLSDFSKGLNPDSKPILGVKIPELRKIAKEIAKGDYEDFLRDCPNTYFEFQSLHAMVIGYAKDDIETILHYADEFLPSIQDWSVNDTFCQTFHIARKYPERAWQWVEKCGNTQDAYSQRVAAVMALSHFLNKEYIDRVLALMDRLKFDSYYTRMGVAWCVATAYAKCTKETRQYLSNNKLDDKTFNKSIQKMIESYRVPEEDKEMLRKMKR